MKILKMALPVLPATLVLVPATAMAPSSSCDALAKMSFADATIDSAQSLPAGDFTPPSGTSSNPETSRNLPAFCRVAATLKPSSDSDIKIEVWLPSTNWNGKFQAVGNGGWAGAISYRAMANALRNGYATTSTDTGHVGGNGRFIQGHPEKLVDFAFRSVHEMTVKAKAIIGTFYGNAPQRSYWNGCSTGGRQGLMEATRFPEDFDGIIAGAPANPRARMNSWSVSIAQAIHANSAGHIPERKYSTIHEAAVAACDTRDGVSDGLIENPKACQFDPGVLMCTGADGDACLTSPQVETAKKILSPGRYSNGNEYWPGFEPGSELGWSFHVAAEPQNLHLDHFKYVVFNDENWDWRTFRPDSDIARAEAAGAESTDVTTTDLSAFTRHNGKLILYHGWADATVAPQATIDYYKGLRDRTEGAAESVRLFMAPGVGHCGGGDGPNDFDMSAALDQWVTTNRPPEQVVASHSTNGNVDRTRPLCPYPQVAQYIGSGSINDASNFTCSPQ